MATAACLHHLQEAAGTDHLNAARPRECAARPDTALPMCVSAPPAPTQPSLHEVPGAAVLMATGPLPQGPGHHLPLAEDTGGMEA